MIILDEPTVGLDPAQIIEIRELIRELGRDHTMVLSSHILSEVQAVCDHIMIISHGELVASDTPENLTALFAGQSTYHLIAKGIDVDVAAVLRGVEGVETFAMNSEGEEIVITLTPKDNADLREVLFCAFAAAGVPLLEMTRSRASLEDVFLELTQDKPKEDEKKRRVFLHRKAKEESADVTEVPAADDATAAVVPDMTEESDAEEVAGQ